ncbi:MAG: hypothetical protein EXQ81_05745 [Thermoleophilia bacterium]|nr:hypothetical protein [Thermoleophilia bacterium]
MAVSFALAALTGVALAVARAAPAADIGANDDTGKWAADSGAMFFSRMVGLGLRQSVMTVRWTPSDPLSIPDEDALGLAIQTAELAGLRVVLAVYPYPTREVEAGLARPAAFAAWLTGVANRYPTVKQYAVMNEPNQPAFLRPQFRRDGSNASAAIAGAFLAAGYDALKAVDPTILVVGIGLSPRGNDRPNAPNNISTSPVRFLAALGTWYRASGRQLPLMDGLSFHSYPDRPTDPLTRGSAWPNAGFADLGRIKQAIWDAFRDTPQPTTVNGLRLYLDEVGWQVATVGLPGYAGEENVAVTSEETQAGIYASLVRSVACDPQVAELNFFGFYDDAERGGFQAALHQVDGTPRLSAAAVQAAITETATGCADSVAPWFPARRVIGAVAPAWVVTERRTIRFSAKALEGATVVACLFPGRLRAPAAAAAMETRTAASTGCHGATALPHRPVAFAFRRVGRLAPATIAVRFVAESSDRRSRTFSRTLG